MQEFPTLKNPPIVEAVLDVRVFKEVPIDPAYLENLEDALGSAYLVKKTIGMFEARLPAANQLGPGRKHEVTNMVHGYRYETPKDDFQFVAMFRTDGMALSLLGDYSSWKRLYDEMLRLWAVYHHTVEPDSIVRLGTRFINRIDFQGGAYSDFFTAPVPKPVTVRGRMESLQVVSRYSYDGQVVPVKGVLRHTLEEYNNTDSSAIIDIDAFVELTGDSEQREISDLSSMEPFLDSLRAVKNDLFFSSLTQEAIQSFEPIST